jgi:hypothetical protein
MCMQYKQYLIDLTIFVTSASGMYVLWTLVHFIAAHIYIKHCVGSTALDMAISVFYVSSPYCQGVSWLIYTGSRQIAYIWMVLGTYLSTKLLHGFLTKSAVP